MKKIIILLCLLVSMHLGAVTYYSSNAIWMLEQQQDALPESGYAVSVRSEAGTVIREGYLDGVLKVRFSETRKEDELTVLQELLAEDERRTQTYRKSALIREVHEYRDGKEEWVYRYDTRGSLNSIAYWKDDIFVHEDFFFRTSSGELRAIYRYGVDDVVYFMNLQADGLTMGAPGFYTSETWKENTYTRTVFEDDQEVHRLVETVDGVRRTVTEHLMREGIRKEQLYVNDLLTRKETVGSATKVIHTFVYDQKGRKTSERIEETTFRGTTVTRIVYAYHGQEGYLTESRVSRDGQLQEVLSYHPDGSLKRKDVYRAGKLLLTVDYE